ncbi:gfo/Idh/MocA family oxidoreductase, partial [Vibrio owensii]
MKIGIIGLGDIAQKAYLPVITQLPNVELVFCTRNA